MKRWLYLLLAAAGMFVAACSSSPNRQTEEGEETGVTPETPEPTEKQYAVIGYLPLNDYEFDTQYALIEWEYLTHVNVCFARVNADATLNASELEANLDRVMTDARAHQVKVFFSVAANERGSFSQAISTERGRRTLVDALVAYANEKGFDGIDIDYEEHDNTSADATASQNLLNFAKKLHEAKGDLQLSSAVYGTWLYYGKEWANYFDYINVMSYDGNNVFGTTTPVQHASYEDFVAHLSNWSSSLDAPRAKIIGGLPVYGYSWDNALMNAGVVDEVHGVRYHNLLSFYGETAADTDVLANGKTLHNGRPTIQKKCAYVKENNYGGVMLWQLLQDGTKGQESLRLLRAIGEAMSK